MKREDLLAQGLTEEQVTTVLNTFHGIKKENDKLKGQILEQDDLQNTVKELQDKLDAINKEKLTEQEKLELDKQEIAKNLRESKIIKNKAKAKEILSGLDIDEAIINTLVTEDEASTISNATALKNKFDSYKEVVEKQTKEAITNLDVKPNVTNVPQDDGSMTWEKFSALSVDEQNKFALENPTEFENL